MLAFTNPPPTGPEEQRKEYDFSKGKRNTYAKQLKQSVTMRVDRTTLEYFKGLAGEIDVPYQTLINLYLRDCAMSGRRPDGRSRPGAGWRWHRARVVARWWRLFYRGDGRLMAATLARGESFAVVSRDTLFSDVYQSAPNPHANYYVMADGKHFVFLKTASEGDMIVVANWKAAVRARMAQGAGK